MHLYFIRHGQSHVNLPDFSDPNRDQGLTALGHEQAGKLAAWLPTIVPDVEAIYSSSLLRARETATPLAEAYGLVPIFEDALREMGSSRWNHLAYEVGQLPPPGTIEPSAFPYAHLTTDVEGESYMHFRVRVGRFVEHLAQEQNGKTVLIVCHGGVVDAMFDHVFNIGAWRQCEVKTHNTSVSLFEYINLPNRAAWRLHFHNRIDHLNG
jgi:broad specificity phosphatase PhoE